MNQQEEQDRRNLVLGLLAKKQKLSEQDIQTLRENAQVAGSDIADTLQFRMEVELLDSIRKLDRSSSTLTVVAIAVGIVAAFGAVYPILHH